VKQTLEGKNQIVNIGNIDYNFEYEDRIITTPKHYAYVKIAEGCNNNCSYCIIPKLRGRFRSRDIKSILKEVEMLVSKGVKEIILVAQDTTMYGIDIYGKKMLSALLNEIEKVEGIEWIRLMYAYPEEINDELINTIKHSRKICHYLDMPLQHISNNILKKMKRRSTKEQITALIEKIRIEIPDIIIRTSLIVGFPSESEEDFNELKEFIKNYKLDRVGIFAYSAEEGTLAAEMDEQIDDEIKNMRKEMLMGIQSKISSEKNKSLVGKKLRVIIEGLTKENKFYGRSYGDAPEIDQTVFVNNSTHEMKIGSISEILITKAYTYDLVGDEYYESGK
jgi:ribosomal protein S12 methylthiotransferase